jgi:hypothetical protein
MSEKGLVEYFEGLVEYMKTLGYEDPRDKRIAELEALLNMALKDLHDIRAGHTVTVEYDMSPVMTESKLRDKLVELGWTPPALGDEDENA